MREPKLSVSKKAVSELRKGSMLIYESLVKKAIGEPQKGDLVKLVDEKGKFLAQAYYNPNATAVAQVVSLRENEKIDEGFYRKKILLAREFREKALGYRDTHRMFFGEADGIPGLLIDRFRNICVLQTTCPGVEAWKNKIAEMLLEIKGVDTVAERNDSRNRQKTDLPKTKGVLAGNKKTQVVIEEEGVKFEVDVLRGHKTGFYLDQRENRIGFGKMAGKGDAVLDVFSYTGGFGLHAAAKGAKVTMLDMKEALEQAKRNASLNKFEGIRYAEGNAFDETKKMVEKQEKFDLVSCDPPAFAQKRGDEEKAMKAYHQINYNCMRLVKENGVLATSTCSHFMPLDVFTDVLLSAAANAGKKASLIEQRFQAPDHLHSMSTKKGLYLKCLFLKINSLK